MERSIKRFNFERGVNEEEVVAVDVRLCGASISIIIVCCNGFELASSRTNSSSRCGNIGMEVNIGQSKMDNVERQEKEGSKWCSTISMKLRLSRLTSTEESLLLHHPLRLGQQKRLICLRDGKSSIGVDEEENSLRSPMSNMYSIASIS